MLGVVFVLVQMCPQYSLQHTHHDMHVHYFNCKVSPPTSYMYINIPTSCTVVCFVEVGFGGLLALLEPDTGMKKKSFEFLLWLHYNA